jgi:hypothetical protein
MSQALMPPVVATLLADVSKYTTSLGKARADMAKTASESTAHTKTMSNGMTSMSSTAKTAMAGAGLAVLAFGLKSADTYTSIGKDVMMLKRVTGESAETSSQWRYVAQQSGMTADQLAGSIKFLSKNIEAGKPVFEQNGIAIHDNAGHLLSFNTVMLETADKFHGMQDGFAKNELAMKLFGKSGMSMIPMLNKGGEAIKALQQQAKDYGLVLTGSNLDAVKQSIAAHRQLDAAMAGLQVTIGQKVLPVVTDVVKFFSELPGPIREALGPITLFGAAGLALVGVGTKIFGMLTPIVGGLKAFVAGLYETEAAEAGATAGLTAMGSAVAVVGIAVAAGLISWEVWNSKVKEAGKSMDTALNPAKVKATSASYDEMSAMLGRVNDQIGITSDKIKSSSAPWDANYRDQLSAGGASLMKFGEELQRMMGQADGLSDATGKSRDETLRWIETQEAAGHTFNSTAEAIASFTGNNNIAGLSAEDAASALKSERQSLKDLNDEVHASIDPFFALIDAQQKNVDAGGKLTAAQMVAYKAQVDVNDARAKSGPNSDAARTAGLALMDAEQKLSAAQQDTVRTGLDVQTSANTIAEKMKSEGLTVEAATAQLNDMVAKNLITADTASAVAGKIGAVVDVTGRVYSPDPINVTANTGQAMAALTDLSTTMIGLLGTAYQLNGTLIGRSVPGHAAGSTDVRDGVFTSGEDGPELMEKDGDRLSILSAPQTRRKRANERSHSRGEMVIREGDTVVNFGPGAIVLHAPPGTDPRSFGREVAGALAAFIRAGGTPPWAL